MKFNNYKGKRIRASEKSALFIVLPEEDLTKYFMVSLMIQQLYREILSVADENGGKLKNRVVFSASRSRRLSIVPIIQSFGQLEKNYGKEGAEIITDNCQDIIFGGFAPNSQTAEVLSRTMGSRTVLCGTVNRGQNDPSQSLQMMERALMTADELKSIAKDLNLSRSTVKRALHDLTNAGLVEKEKRYRENGGCSSNRLVLK